MPKALKDHKEELGLTGDFWATIGASTNKFHQLAQCWLNTEVVITKLAKPDLTQEEIFKSNIPEAWKDWMAAKELPNDHSKLDESFGTTFKVYLQSLDIPSLQRNPDAVLELIWARDGRTGIVGLLACLHWEAVASGVGNDWRKNAEQVELLFDMIRSAPEL